MELKDVRYLHDLLEIAISFFFSGSVLRDYPQDPEALESKE